MNLTTGQLAELVSAEADLPKATAGRVIKSLTDAIQDALANGETVSIPGFGSFTTVTRAARTARNPRTGETIDVPAKPAVKFKPAKALKDAVNS